MGDPPYVGGIENAVDTIIHSDLTNFYEFVTFDTYRPPDPKRSFFHKLLFAFSLFVTCGYFVASHKPKIVHIHFCSNIDFWKHSICLFVSRLFGVKTIYHLHGGSFETVFNSYGRFKQYIVRVIFKLPHRVIALSEYWANFLSRIMESKRLCVVGNPIDIEWFSRPSTDNYPDSICNVLLLGRVGRHKGHYDVVKALPAVLERCPKTVVFFAGPDDEPGATVELTNLARQYGIAENIRFLGPVTGKDKLELFHSCSMMILPSHGENLPISLMEGMAARLPVLASSVGAIPELLENGELGVLITAGDYQELASGIIHIFQENPEKINRVIELAYNKVRDTCDVKKISSKLDRIYKESVKK